MDKKIEVPRWQKEILTFKAIKSLFIIEGNINDEYPVFNRTKNGDQVLAGFKKLNEVICRLFDDEAGAYHFLFCDPLLGFNESIKFQDKDRVITRSRLANMVRFIEDNTKEMEEAEAKIYTGGRNQSQRVPQAYESYRETKNSEIIRHLMTNRIGHTEVFPIVCIMDYASRFITDPSNITAGEKVIFQNLYMGVMNSITLINRKNTLILIVNKLGDLPDWFYKGNPMVRTLSIPVPDKDMRKAFVDSVFPEMYINDYKDSDEYKRAKDKFIDLTGGMKLIELDELRRLIIREQTPVLKLSETVNLYKYGFKDNPWETFFEKAKNIRQVVEERVKGQKEAVDKMEEILQRSVTGLSGLQHSSDTKPKGILFLAGPTGTGKTELVKAVTAHLFGDESSYIRFDMSEYREEHADQKLFGAPPGYIGYDQGGQLTNAMKQNPFSILLFDEIDKAHPGIMDKFLQILEDGRMTDGQGQTVYFSETLIFFTSNIGITKEKINSLTGKTEIDYVMNPGDDLVEIIKSVKDAMRSKFKPEFINRIGENVVVFNFLSPGISDEIVDAQINKINRDVMKKYPNISIILEANDKSFFYTQAHSDEVRKYGGRGIGNMLENLYLNPLAKFIFEHSVHNKKLYIKLDKVKTENNCRAVFTG